MPFGEVGLAWHKVDVIGIDGTLVDRDETRGIRRPALLFEPKIMDGIFRDIGVLIAILQIVIESVTGTSVVE